MMRKCLVKLFIFFSFVFGWISCESNEHENAYCMELNPQNSMDMEQILGTWYGNEIITHNDGDKEGVFYFNTCVRIHISNITGQITSTEASWRDYSGHSRPQEYSKHFSYLRLIWDENDTTLEYTVRYENARRGFWISSGPQNGDFVHLQYEQFKGTIQVMKAVGNHLVLTFCNKSPGSKLFSIILTRKPEPLTTEDLESIRKLLRRRGLSTSHIRKVCTSGSLSLSPFFVLLFFLAFVTSKYL